MDEDQKRIARLEQLHGVPTAGEWAEPAVEGAQDALNAVDLSPKAQPVNGNAGSGTGGGKRKRGKR